MRDGDLDGRVFVVQSIEGHELVPGYPVLLPFHDGSLFTLNGCNAIGGSYSFDSEMQTIVMVDEDGTEMACEPEALMEQDDLVMEMLTAGPMLVTLDGGEFVFDTPSGRVTFLDREIADPDAGS